MENDCIDWLSASTFPCTPCSADFEIAAVKIGHNAPEKKTMVEIAVIKGKSFKVNAVTTASIDIAIRE